MTQPDHQPPGLSAYLSRPEWQLCFALSAAHAAMGVEQAEACESLGQSLRYAIRYLSDNGLEFQGIVVTADGRILPATDYPVCEGNMASVALVALGKSPDYLTHFRDGIEYAQEAVPHLRQDIEMMRESLADIEAMAEDMQDYRKEIES